MQYSIEFKVDEELIEKSKGGNVANEDQKPDPDSKAVAKAQKTAVAVVKELGLMATRELVVSRVGEFTRDSLLQRKIDTTLGIATTIGAFRINPIVGAITVATSVASQSISYNLNAEKEFNRLQISRERAGYLNRSR